MMLQNNLLKVEYIDFSYRTKEIFSDASITLKTGSINFLVGENGCGKSTLIKLLIGSLKPSKGSIKVFDKSNKEAIKEHLISYVPQQNSINISSFPSTPLELLIATKKNHFFPMLYRKRNRLEAEKILTNIGLKDKTSSSLCYLSGGELQKAMIATCLMSNSHFILLDEPDSSLDSKSVHELAEVIIKLNKEGYSFLIVTHDISFVRCIENSKVFAIKNKKIEEYDSKDLI